MKKRIALIYAIFLFLCTNAEQNQIYKTIETEIYAQSVINKLSTEEKVGQLIMIAVRPLEGEKHLKEVEEAIKKYKIGGIIIFKCSAKVLVKTINRYQSISERPLLVAIDGEWGLNMRIPDVIKYPYNMTLGGIQNNQLIYELGEQMARQFKRVGVHVNFAPVVDINNNPKNPVIGYRSFSDNKENVAKKAWAYAQGLQDNNILAVAKHFPGHGDTEIDSHIGLPIIHKSKDTIEKFELYPFKYLIKKGVGGVMIGHLSVPSIDSSGTPASLSSKFMKDLLVTDLGFSGLSFSDAMNMGAIVNEYHNGEQLAIENGMDVIEYPYDINNTIKGIKHSIDSNRFSLEELNEKCQKILMLKKWVGASKDSINLDNLKKELNNKEAKQLNQKLFDNALCLLKNDKHLIPISSQDRVAMINLGSDIPSKLKKEYSKRIGKFDNYHLTKFNIKRLKKIEASHNKIVVNLLRTSFSKSKNFRISKASIKIINRLIKSDKVIFNFYSTPYALDLFDQINQAHSILLSYQQTSESYRASVKILFGEIEATATLPYSTLHFEYGDGLQAQGMWWKQENELYNIIDE